MLTLSLVAFITITSSAQEVQKLDFCNCVDKIDQVNPVLNGKFQRTCNGILNETGSFKNGAKDGEWATYSKKGNLIKKVIYEDGKLNGKIELFYFNGKPKVTASFAAGKPSEEWIYYSSNGKILIQGKYESGKPVAIWSIYNGSKPAIQYDFSSSKYIIQNKLDIRKSGGFMRNDNSGEYFFYYFSTEVPIDDTAPLGGQKFAISLMQDLYEMPLDYWDTFISYDYLAIVSLSPDHTSSFSINRNDETYDIAKQVIYPFIVNTNPASKIKKVDHTDLSRKLLDFKIKETFSLLPPWVFAGKGEVRIHLPYVINRLIDFSKPEERRYN